GNGAKEQWGYRADRAEELQSWVNKDAQAHQSARLYDAYDPDGRLTASTETIDGVTRKRAFTYDPIGRIQHVLTTPQGGGPAFEDDTFSYDALGNLVQSLSSAGVIATKRTFSTAAGDPDRVCRAETTVGNTAPEPPGKGCTHSYDAHGNVIAMADTGATRQFSY